MAKFLITGFMGSGKSSLLLELKKSKELKKFKFLDLDECIELDQQESINEIVSRKGIEFFRKIENTHLEALILSSDDCIIALGGGALHLESWATIAANKVQLIWIDTPFEVCLSRVKREGDKRPLSKLSKEELYSLYEQRCKYYKKAQFRTTGETEELIQFITSSTI